MVPLICRIQPCGTDHLPFPYSVWTHGRAAASTASRGRASLCSHGIFDPSIGTQKKHPQGVPFFGAADLPKPLKGNPSADSILRMDPRQGSGLTASRGRASSLTLLARDIRPLRRHAKKHPQGVPFLVPLIGVEPIWYHYQWILSPSRLPIPPQRQANKLYNTRRKKSSDLAVFTSFLF